MIVGLKPWEDSLDKKTNKNINFYLSCQFIIYVYII